MKFKNFVACEASAGSGKTFALTIRYISLLFMGAKSDRILTLTFTNKAANEMRERIEKTIKNLHKKEYENELAELESTLGIGKEEILSKKNGIFKEFIKNDIYILTIDKFCTQILRKFALYVGLMPDFTVEKRDDKERLLELFIKKLDKYSLYKEFVKFAAFEDKKVNHIFQTLLSFYEKSIDIPHKKSPSVSFNENDVLEEFERLKSELLACDKLSDRARNTLFSIDEVSKLAKTRWICKDSLGEYSDFKKCFKEYMDELFLKIKEGIKEYYEYRESRYIKDLKEFLELYKESNYELKRLLNDLSFSDIANFTYRVLHDEIDKEFFYFRLDAKFDHILIDEFQDTSTLQYKILKPLFEEIVSGKGVKEDRSIFYVGDVKQSIYRFRGGSKELFYYVKDEFGFEVEKLYKNYRSKKVVVEFVNEVFRDKIEGYFDQIPHQKEGGFVKVAEDDDVVAKAVSLLKEILKKGANQNDIALLVYTNDDALTLEEAIVNEIEGVKVSTDASVLLKNSPQVKAIIEAMKYVYFKEEICKRNFLSLIGKDGKTEGALEGFYRSLQPSLFIKKAMDRFGFGELEVFEFLQKSYEYDDLEEFLFSLEEFNDEISIKASSGIKILTVHKSKGLEFKHLFVCDKFKKDIGDRDSFLIEEEGLEVKNIYLKAPNKECFDLGYKKALEKEKRLRYEDEMNVKYVAFTRARDSLFVIKKEKKSKFDDLNLKECEIGEFDPQIKKESSEPSKEEIFVYEKFKTGKQEVALKSSQKDEERDFASISFGLALHYMLEMLEDFDKNSLQKAYIATKNRYEDIVGSEAMDDIKSRVLRLLDDSFFTGLIKGKSIDKELQVLYNNELRQFDLMLEDEDVCVVVDYKSSKAFGYKHKKQVEGYMEILKNLKEKEIRAYLCYLTKESVEFVEVKNERV